MKMNIRVGMDIHTIKQMVKRNSSFEYKAIQPSDNFHVLDVCDSFFLKGSKTIEAVNEEKGVFVFDDDEVEPCDTRLRKPY